MHTLRTTASQSFIALSRRTNSTHHSPPATAATTTTANPEGFGKPFYLTIAAIVGIAALYKLDNSQSGTPLITRLIEKYHSSYDEWEARNTIHTQMVERAAADRSLFYGSRTKKTINLKYPEAFNMGSPWNQEAGWASGDISSVRKHLEAQREKHAESLRK